MKKIQGFTLIELMVTIAVLAIIAMMAAPTFGDIVAKQRLNTTAKDLADLFGQARAQSAVLRKNVKVHFKEKDEIPAGTEDKYNAVNYHWVSPYKDIKLTSDTTEVEFLPIGLVTSRNKEIANPAYDETKPADPVTNPEKISVPIPLVFSICSEKLQASREISISKTGIIERIESKEGACP